METMAHLEYHQPVRLIISNNVYIMHPLILVCSNAKKYLHSKKPLVKFHATVFLEYEGSKCPPRNGVLVPPGPPPG